MTVETRLEPRAKSVTELTVKLFADGADAAGMRELYRNPLIRGFTTNPTLMRKAGVTDYRVFARDILQVITDRPISCQHCRMLLPHTCQYSLAGLPTLVETPYQ